MNCSIVYQRHMTSCAKVFLYMLKTFRKSNGVFTFLPLLIFWKTVREKCVEEK
jgi:hypothetical protein